MKKIWPFSFYVLYYAALSSFLPFIVLFYQQLEFSGTQIGLLTGIPPLITLFAAPFWTSTADVTRRHRLIMSLGIGVALISVLALQSLTTFIAIFIVIITYNIFFSPVVSLADSATMAMLGDDRSMYGRIRLGGTLGWGMFAPIAGILVDNYGLKVAFWCFSAIMFITFFVSQKIVHDPAEHSRQSNNQGIRYFLTNRRWIFFLLAACIGGAGTLNVSAFLYPYMAEMGASESIMGVVLMLATLTELPIFFFGNRLVRRFGAQRLFTIALILMAIRSLLLAWVMSPIAVLFVQGFGGTIYPMLWSAGVAYADENAPAGLKSTAQGLFGAMSFGIGSAVGGLLGGLLLERLGGHGMFLVFGLLILGGLAMIELVKRLLPVEQTSRSAV